MKKNQYYAVSRPIEEVISALTIKENKILGMALSCLHYTASDNDREVRLSKKDVMTMMDYDRDLGRFTNDLKKVTNAMTKKAVISIGDTAKKHFENISIISTCYLEKGADGCLVIRFTEDAMPYLENLKDDYITISLNDLKLMPNTKTGRYALVMYMYLRRHGDSRKSNQQIMSIERIKDILDIPETKYIRQTETGIIHNRDGFESKVLTPTLDILRQTTHIRVSSTLKTGDKYRRWTAGQPIKYTFCYLLDSRYNTHATR